MRVVEKQSGFSLFGILVFGVVIAFGLYYGRALVGITYHSLQIKNMIASISASEKTESNARKKLTDTIGFERLSDVVKEDDFEIETEGDRLVISVNYRECAEIGATWEMCAKYSLRSGK